MFLDKERVAGSMAAAAIGKHAVVSKASVRWQWQRPAEPKRRCTYTGRLAASVARKNWRETTTKYLGPKRFWHIGAACGDRMCAPSNRQKKNNDNRQQTLSSTCSVCLQNIEIFIEYQQ